MGAVGACGGTPFLGDISPPPCAPVSVGDTLCCPLTPALPVRTRHTPACRHTSDSSPSWLSTFFCRRRWVVVATSLWWGHQVGRDLRAGGGTWGRTGFHQRDTMVSGWSPHEWNKCSVTGLQGQQQGPGTTFVPKSMGTSAASGPVTALLSPGGPGGGGGWYWRCLRLHQHHQVGAGGPSPSPRAAGAWCPCGGGTAGTRPHCVLRAPVVCGVSSLGIDHTSILGDTMEKIAWQKGGIFKVGGSSPPPAHGFRVPSPIPLSTPILRSPVCRHSLWRSRSGRSRF